MTVLLFKPHERRWVLKSSFYKWELKLGNWFILTELVKISCQNLKLFLILENPGARNTDGKTGHQSLWYANMKIISLWAFFQNEYSRFMQNVSQLLRIHHAVGLSFLMQPRITCRCALPMGTAMVCHHGAIVGAVSVATSAHDNFLTYSCDLRLSLTLGFGVHVCKPW